MVSLSAWAQGGAAASGQAASGGAAQGQPAAQSGPQYKDRAEYDLVQAFQKETDPAKKLDILKQWQEKYPNSDFKQPRYNFMILTYQQLGQGKEMMRVAKEMAADDPTGAGNYWVVVLTPGLQDTSPQALDDGEKAANALLSNLDKTFDNSKKPANVNDADWKKQRDLNERLAHRALGWIAMARKNWPTAQTEFAKDLQMDPNDAEASYWLGSSTLQQSIQEKKPDLTSPALYSYAHALGVTGPEALPAASRPQVQSYFDKVYTQWHGSKDGEDKVLNDAKASPVPPPDYKIVSKIDLANQQIEKENELIKSHPEVALWQSMKGKLTADNGEQYFDSDVKGAAVPMLRGKLVSQSPATRPTKLVLAMDDPTTPEVTLDLAAALPGKADPGTELTFEGIGKSFTKSPFMLTFDVEKGKVSGWPVTAPAAPAHRAAPARRKR